MGEEKLMPYYEMQGEHLDIFRRKLSDDLYVYYLQTVEEYWKNRKWYLCNYLCDFTSFCNTPSHIRRLDEEYYSINKNDNAFDYP